MQPQENTSARWQSIINDLTLNSEKSQLEIAELTRNRDALALDAELNGNGALEKLKPLQTGIAGKRCSVRLSLLGISACDHIELRRVATCVTHRKPLKEYVIGFVDRWVKPDGKETNATTA